MKFVKFDPYKFDIEARYSEIIFIFHLKISIMLHIIINLANILLQEINSPKLTLSTKALNIMKCINNGS